MQGLSQINIKAVATSGEFCLFLRLGRTTSAIVGAHSMAMSTATRFVSFSIACAAKSLVIQLRD